MNHQEIPVGDEQISVPASRIRRMSVYHIVDREGIDPIWTKVGVAFVNRDGSLNLFLDLIPINGRLHVRDRQVKTPKK